MEYEVKVLDDGIGFLSYTHDGYQVLSTLKNIKSELPKIGVSLCSGCAVRCKFCFTNGYQKFRTLTVQEIINQVKMVIAYGQRHKIIYTGIVRIGDWIFPPRIKISMKQMGDCLLNPFNTIEAIETIAKIYPAFVFVVSTSGPKLQTNKEFFKRISKLDADVNLQFSLHTTSDKERKILCSAMPMMSLKDISRITRKPFSFTTLNFVMFDGFEYSIDKIAKLFKTTNTFIKVNYIDKNTFTEHSKLKDMPESKVKTFTKQLGKYGFKWDFRGKGKIRVE